MVGLHFPWLEVSFFIPLIGCLWLLLLRPSALAARWIATTTSACAFACALAEWYDFSNLKAFEAHDHWSFLGFTYNPDLFVVDELSAILLPLAALVYLLVIVSTSNSKLHRFSFALTLLSQAIVLATLSCRASWFLVFLLSAATLPPWLEMRRRTKSTRVFIIHMGVFVFLLTTGWTLQNLTAGTSPVLSSVSGAMLTGAALLRSGIAPVHCWLTDLFEKASFGTAILFVTPLTGAYAVMRFVLPIAPNWALQSIAIVSLFTAVYASAMALVQTEARRYFCYVLLSNASLVLVGLELVTPIGMAGALCVWLSIMICLSGFGLTIRSIEARLGRVSLSDYHGVYRQFPMLAGFFLLTGLASIGFPATIGFVGLELLVEGAVDIYPLVGTLVVVAAGLNGIGILNSYFRIFTGNRDAAHVLLPTSRAECFSVFVVSVLILGGGLFPQPGVHGRYHAAVQLSRQRFMQTNRNPEHPSSNKIPSDWDNHRGKDK